MPRNGDPTRSVAGKRVTEEIHRKPTLCNRLSRPTARAAFLRMQCGVTLVQEPRQRRPPTPTALRPTAPGWPRHEAYPGSPRPVGSKPQRGCGPARIWRLEPGSGVPVNPIHLERSPPPRPFASGRRICDVQLPISPLIRFISAASCLRRPTGRSPERQQLHPKKAGQPQPHGGGIRQPGATPRGSATTSCPSLERAAQDPGGVMCGQAWLGWSARSGLGLITIVGHRTAGLRPGLSWAAPLGRRAGTSPGTCRETAFGMFRFARFILEKAVGTTDCTKNTDRQGLGLDLPHTCKVSGLPRGKPPFQRRPSVKSVVQATAAFRFIRPLRGSARTLVPAAIGRRNTRTNRPQFPSTVTSEVSPGAISSTRTRRRWSPLTSSVSCPGALFSRACPSGVR